MSRRTLALVSLAVALTACAGSSPGATPATSTVPPAAPVAPSTTGVPDANVATTGTTVSATTSPATTSPTTATPPSSVAVTTTALVPVELTELPRCAPEYPFGPPAASPAGTDVDMAALETSLGEIFFGHPNIVGLAYVDGATGEVVIGAIDTVNAERQAASIDLQGLPHRIEVTKRTQRALDELGYGVMRASVPAGVAGSYRTRRDGRTEITPDDEQPGTLERIARIAGERLGAESAHVCIGRPG